MIALQRAQQAVDPGASHFWREVARLVPGKSADECFARTYEGHPTPGDVDDGPGTAPGKGTKIAGARATKGQADARQRMRERRWEQREEELLTYEDDAFEVFEFDETPQTTPVKATRLAAVVHMAVGSDGGDDAGGLARRVSPRRAGGKSAGGGQLAARLAARRSAQEARDGYIERWLKKRGGRATARAEGDASAEARQQAQAAASSPISVRTPRRAAAARAPRVKSPGETDDEDVPAEAYFDESDEEAWPRDREGKYAVDGGVHRTFERAEIVILRSFVSRRCPRGVSAPSRGLGYGAAKESRDACRKFSFFVARNHRARPLASSGGTSHGVVAGGSVGDFRTRLAEVDSRNARARTVVRGASSSSPGGEMRRKLRILCLHSFRTSGEILREQVRLAGWEETLGDLVEFHVMDARTQRADPYPPTSSPSSPTCPTASGGTPPSAPTRTRPGERR